MTPQERTLIDSVFDRIETNPGGPRDAEAEAQIAERMRRQPGAAYDLVQGVILLELGFKQAQDKIAELERALEDARRGTQAAPAQPQGGGFLAGLNPWGRGSVPRSGAAPAAVPAPAFNTPIPAPGQPYGQGRGAMAPGLPLGAGSMGAGPMGMGGGFGQPAGGGFLRNAATLAAGIAGGTLIAQGLSGLFSGGHGLGSPWGGQPEVVENVTVNEYGQGGASPAAYDNGGDAGGQGGYQDASYDDQGGFDAGFDDGGFDDI